MNAGSVRIKGGWPATARIRGAMFETGTAIATGKTASGIETPAGMILLGAATATERTVLGIETGTGMIVLETGIAIGMIVLETAIAMNLLGTVTAIEIILLGTGIAIGTTARMSGTLAAHATRDLAATEKCKAIAITIPVVTETLTPPAIRTHAATGMIAAATATTRPEGIGTSRAGGIGRMIRAWPIEAPTRLARAAGKTTIPPPMT